MSNPTQIQKDKVSKAICDLAADPDIIALVKEIEGTKVKTTKWNYGKYLQVLGQWGNASPLLLKVCAAALIKAGASYEGVSAAAKILGGGE